MKKRLFIPLFLLLLHSCNKSKLPLEFPNQYDGSDFVANTYDQYALRLQYDALVNEAAKGRDSGIVVLYNDLSNLFNAGNPSLKISSSAYFATQMDTTLGWLKDLAQSSGLKYIPGTSSTKGGIYHGYLFNERGLELQQLIEKGLLSATFFNTATQLMNDGITPKESDQILALFGAYPDFPNTPTKQAFTPISKQHLFACKQASKQAINTNKTKKKQQKTSSCFGKKFVLPR
jgi:hypothetical protein